MRILFLSTSMGLGGADKQILCAAQELRSRGYEVLIVSLTPLGPMGLEAKADGIPIETLSMRRGVPDPRGLFQLAKLVRHWQPDVLHSHMVHANLMARALRMFVSVPVTVSTIHNIYEGGPVWMAAYRLTNPLVDRVTIISEAAANRFTSERIVPRELLEVIPNGVDTDRFQRLPAGTREAMRASLGLTREFAWLAVGRFEIAKDYPNMLRAFAHVLQRSPQATLLLVGRGSLQAETESLARELRLGDSVRFLGVRDDIPEIMNACDGYVMSSAWEGMPIVLLEAAAAGLPVVTTAVGGNQEVVRDGENGFLVPPRDAEALGRAMQRLMDLPEQARRAMGVKGQEHVRRHYGLEGIVNRWEELYREIWARKGLAATSPRSA